MDKLITKWTNMNDWAEKTEEIDDPYLNRGGQSRGAAVACRAFARRGRSEDDRGPAAGAGQGRGGRSRVCRAWERKRSRGVPTPRPRRSRGEQGTSRLGEEGEQGRAEPCSSEQRGAGARRAWERKKSRGVPSSRLGEEQRRPHLGKKSRCVPGRATEAATPSLVGAEV